MENVDKNTLYKEDIKVYGMVQRVGYRRYILEKARKLKLSGYIKNEPDDSASTFMA